MIPRATAATRGSESSTSGAARCDRARTLRSTTESQSGSAVPSRTAPLLMFLAVAGLLAGCQREEKIEHYQQLKPEVLLQTYFHESPPQHTVAPPTGDADVPQTHRMLSAIVPHSPQFWFF